jgi:hypothetical protein
MFNGRVDVIRRDIISGWVGDYDDPDRELEIVVFVDGEQRGRYIADRPRRDLRALRIYGNGNHGFSVELSPQLSYDDDHDVIVRPVARGGTLDRGHCRISKGLLGDQAITVIDDELPPLKLAGSEPPRFVLHIGPHKTGTTYLQAAFSESRAELLAGGVLYPDTSFAWVKPGDQSHAELSRSLAALDTTYLPESFDRLTESEYDTILLSAEDLTGMSGQSLRYLRSLLGGRPVDIVFYCRRWTELLPSVWQETVKQGQTHSLAEFVARHMADPLTSAVINYDIVLGRYAEVFGIDSIRIVSYSDLMDAGIDLYDHFVGSVLNWDEIPTVTRTTPNRTLDPIDVETIRLLHEFAVARSEPAGIDLYQRYARNRSNPHVVSLQACMEKCRASIRVNDAAPGLRDVHDLIFAKYGGRMIGPNSGYNLFQPAVRDLPFVQNNYLFPDGMMQTAIDAYEAVRSR